MRRKNRALAEFKNELPIKFTVSFGNGLTVGGTETKSDRTTKANPFCIEGKLITDENFDFAKKTIANIVEKINSLAEKNPAIQPISEQYFDFLKESMLKNGENGHAIYKDILTIPGQTKKSAGLICRFEDSVLQVRLQVENYKRLRITKAKWLGAVSVSPCQYHCKKWDGKSEPPNGLNGYIFDPQNPPVADLETGERALPGELLGCRCVLIPIIEF